MKAGPIYRAVAAALLVAVLVWLPQASAEKRHERKSAVVQAVKKVSPAVVNISTKYEVRYRSHPFARFGMDDFFRDFFDSGPERKRELNTLGSGVILSEVDPQSKLGRIGAEPGDVIRKIDEIQAEDTQAFYDAVIKYRWEDSVVILLQR
ncbi:MAG: hypothetical protein ACLFUY_00220 [Desulfobacterales bacterium]